VNILCWTVVSMAVALFYTALHVVSFSTRLALAEEISGVMAVLETMRACKGIARALSRATVNVIVICASSACARDCSWIELESGAGRTRKASTSCILVTTRVTIGVSATEAGAIQRLRIIFVYEVGWTPVSVAFSLVCATLVIVCIGTIFIIAEQGLVMSMEKTWRALKCEAVALWDAAQVMVGT